MKHLKTFENYSSKEVKKVEEGIDFFTGDNLPSFETEIKSELGKWSEKVDEFVSENGIEGLSRVISPVKGGKLDTESLLKQASADKFRGKLSTKKDPSGKLFIQYEKSTTGFQKLAAAAGSALRHDNK
jgi:hypothetical protein